MWFCVVKSKGGGKSRPPSFFRESSCRGWVMESDTIKDALKRCVLDCYRNLEVFLLRSCHGISPGVCAVAVVCAGTTYNGCLRWVKGKLRGYIKLVCCLIQIVRRSSIVAVIYIPLNATTLTISSCYGQRAVACQFQGFINVNTLVRTTSDVVLTSNINGKIFRRINKWSILVIICSS